MEQAKAPADIYRHVDRMFPDLRELSDSADAVDRLVSEPGFIAVQALIDAEVEAIDRKLDHAPLQEATEYAHAHGRRGALLAFKDGMAAIRERADERIKEDEAETAAGESAAERQAA